MGCINAIKELKRLIETDNGIKCFCKNDGGVTVITGNVDIGDIAITKIPVVVISDCYHESNQRQFLFSEKEVFVTILCGLLRNDREELLIDSIRFKELIREIIRINPTLTGTAKYSAVIKSKSVSSIAYPLYFSELTVYINYN